MHGRDFFSLHYFTCFHSSHLENYRLRKGEKLVQFIKPQKARIILNYLTSVIFVHR